VPAVRYRTILHSLFLPKQKIERDSSVTLTRGSIAPSSAAEFTGYSFDSDTSLGHQNARSKAMGRRAARIKAAGQERTTHFRVARIGPGWILGSTEGVSGNRNTGYHVAGTFALLCGFAACCYRSASLIYLLYPWPPQ